MSSILLEFCILELSQILVPKVNAQACLDIFNMYGQSQHCPRMLAATSDPIGPSFLSHYSASKFKALHHLNLDDFQAGSGGCEKIGWI